MANYNLGEARGQVVLETDFSSLKQGQKELDRFKDASEDAAKPPQKISGAFVAGMTVVANVVTEVTQTLISSVEQWVSEAVSASDATDKFRQAMEFAGVDGAAIDKAADRAQAYADRTVYSLSDIMNAVAQFTSNGVQDANGLVEAIGNLNAVAGGSPETFQRMLLAITQTAAAGKLTTENWNQIADAIPGGAGALMAALESAGAYTGNFRDAMANGEITAAEFNAALMNLGTDPVAVEAAESVTTMEGAMGNLNATIVGGLTEAINYIKPSLTSLLGAIAQTIQGVFAAIGNVVSYVRANLDWIGPLAVAIGAATAVWIAWNAAITAWQTIVKVATAVQAAFNAVMAANPIMLIVMAIAALVAGLVWFFTQTELGQAIWAEFTRFLSEAWTNLVNVAQAVWNGIMVAIGAVVDWFQAYVWPVIQFVIDMIVAYFTMYYNVVMFIWNGIMAIVGAVVDWFMAHVYPTIKAVVDFLVKLFNFLGQVVALAWQGIVDTVGPIVDGFVSWLTDLWTKFQLGWAIIWAAVQKVINDVWNAIRGFVEPIVSGIVNFISSTWNGLVGIVSGIFNNVKNAIMEPIQNAVDFIGTIKDTIMGFFSGAGDWLFNIGKDIINGFIRGLEAMWNEVGNFFRDLTDMIPEVKGPPRRDRVLLTDNGKLIMQSLYNGLAAEMGTVETLLGGLNNTIPASVNQSIMASVNGGNGARPVQVVVNYTAGPNDGTRSKEDVMAMLGHATELVREELS